MTNVIEIRSHANESESRGTLDALCLEGARTMLHRALEVEVTEYLERIWRDARLGRIHPANSALTREFVAKTALGISPDEQPRWG